MPEQKVQVATGMTICYETHGDPSNPALLLVMGLGGSLTLWRPSFVQRLVDMGYYVIRLVVSERGGGSLVVMNAQ